MQPRSIFLHDDASGDVLEGRVHSREPLNRVFDDQAAPLVHLLWRERLGTCTEDGEQREGAVASLGSDAVWGWSAGVRMRHVPSSGGIAGFAERSRCSP